MVKPPLRTKSIGFKVSQEEYAQLETAAQADGRTLGEWCREVQRSPIRLWPRLWAERGARECLSPLPLAQPCRRELFRRAVSQLRRGPGSNAQTEYGSVESCSYS